MAEEKIMEEEKKEEMTAPANETPAKEDTPSTEPEEVEVPEKFKKIVEQIETMSVLDLHELVKVFEKKFGVSASAVAVVGTGGGDEGDGDGGSGLVTVTLEDAGANKIQVIKVVKDILGLGLKEAKDFTESAPKVVKEAIQKEEAEELKGKLEEAGAKITVA